MDRDETGKADAGMGKAANQQQAGLLAKHWKQSSNATLEPNYAQFRVVVADDDIQICQLVSDTIRNALGCETHFVSTGDEVCEFLASHTVDVLIADMLMPGIHGLELVSKVVSDWPRTDVVVMTGHVDDFPYVEVVKAGGKDFIAKPFQAAELIAKLMRLFRERCLREAQVLAGLKYRSLFELNTDGMVFVDAESRQVLDANAAFSALSERAINELVGAPFLDLLDPFERGRFQEALELCSRTEQGTIGDVVIVTPTGQEVYFDVSVTFISVEAQRIICLAFKDTTEKRKIEEHLVETAQTDSLTGLLNKRTFMTNLEWTIRRAASDDTAVTLVFIDVDGFKLCNDRYGHQTGDEVLHMLGQIIQDNIRRAHDGAYRYGGDEFAIVLLCAKETAVRIAERIRARFEKDENFGTSLSIGVAEHKPVMRGEELVRLADQTLYKAKSLGKNTVCLA